MLALRALPALGFSLALLFASSMPQPAWGESSVAGGHAPVAGRVLVVGDSISAAYGMSLEQGWVALLEQRLKQNEPSVEIVNASISGDTSSGGLRRLPALLDEYRPALVILELGGNDGLRGYPTATLRENLTAMTEAAAQRGARVLILPMEIPPNYGPRYTRAFRNSFRAAADHPQATLGPFMLEGVATDPALMQSDGIHPTVAAQALIVDLLQTAVEQALAATAALAAQPSTAQP